MNKITVFLAVCIMFLLVPFVSAIGVSRMHLDNDMADVANGQNYNMKFNIQNNENKTKEVTFFVETQTPMTINNDGRTFQKSYTMEPFSNKNVDVSFSSNKNAIYKVRYSVSEGGSGTGIKMSFGTSDTFDIRVGNATGYQNFDIPLLYPGFTLLTDSFDVNDVRDLVISSGNIEVSFAGQIINLTGFDPKYVSFGSKSVYINTTGFPQLSKKAVLYFYRTGSDYTIYNNGTECLLNQCKNQNYVSKRLSFEVNPFSGEYSVASSDPAPTTTGSGGGSSGGGGLISPTVNATVQNSTVPAATTTTVPEEKKEEVIGTPAVQPPVLTDKKVTTPPAEAKNNPVQEDPFESFRNSLPEPKVLLITSIISSFILLILSGSLLFYVKMNGVTL
jgi:uncharacterized membrane protein YgcG